MRQYVGARYVPKIYENSLNPSSCDWEAGVTYDALTIVDYNYTSYISRIPVPGSVGAPPSNPTYWAESGAYNGQIAQINSRLDDLDHRITNLNTVVISDSYGTLYPDVTGETMFDELKKFVPDATTYAYSAAGFTVANADGTFLQNFTADSASVSDEDAEKVDIILVAAGRNDWSSTYAAIQSAIGAFVSYCKTKYPNAKVMLAFVANGNNTAATGTRAQQYTVYEAFRDCAAVGAVYMDGAEAILKVPGLMAGDYMHPNANGRKALGQYLAQGLICGKCSVNGPQVTVNIPASSGITYVANGDSLIEEMKDGVVYLKQTLVGKIEFAYNAANVPSNSFLNILLGTIGDGYIRYPKERTQIRQGYMPCKKWVDANTESSMIPAGVNYSLVIDADGSVRLILFGHQESMLISSLYLDGFEVAIPAVDC